MSSLAVLRKNLNNLIDYVTPHLTFINCHMVNFLTEDHWKNFIPHQLQIELENTKEHNQIFNIFWNHPQPKQYTEFNNLINFLNETDQIFYQNFNSICTKDEEFHKELKSLGFVLTEQKNIEIFEFLTSKKKHEIEKTSSLIAKLCKSENRSKYFIIDAGDGKGYLSSRLALEYDLKVLGIDASEVNTESADKRVIKLAKAWNGLNKRAEDISKGVTPPRRGKRKNKNNEIVKNENYKTTTCFITTETNLQKLVQENFPNENPEKFLLSGLHTCGNLAPDSMRLFVKNNQIEILVNIGCCYHLLKEEFIEDKFFNNRKFNDSMNEQFPGFPMCEFLKEKKFYLGRNARMLASQSIDRTVEQQELPNISLFYRALLEVLIINQNPDLANIIQVGKVKCINFPEYVRKCSLKHNLNLENLSNDYLKNLEELYSDKRNLLNIFYLIRMRFSKIIEAIILIDRLIYLKENQIENSFLCKLFDSVISPRCYGIIGIKM